MSDAWLKVTTVDPLVDSDDEGDEFIRYEYSKPSAYHRLSDGLTNCGSVQRLRVIAGIRGTPFSDSAQLGQPPLLELSPHPQSL